MKIKREMSNKKVLIDHNMTVKEEKIVKVEDVVSDKESLDEKSNNFNNGF